MAKLLLARWMSYHKCPQCNSAETFHSHAMKNLHSDWGNVYEINLRQNHLNPNDATLSKIDLCLECGRQWVMYIERVDTEGEKPEIVFLNT